MERLYFGGTILTMEDRMPFAEAILVSNSRIAAVGRLEEVEKNVGKDCKRIDLCGRTLCPAFIDGHSHLTMLATSLGMLNLSGVRSFGEIQQNILAFMKERAIKKGQWVLAFGYDHNLLKEKRHPDKSILDGLEIENPILMTHISGHMGVMNSLALQKVGLSAQTEEPTDGRIGREAGSRELNGYLEEGAFIRASAEIPKMTLEEMLKNLERAQDIYFSYGITTMQDGYVKEEEWKVLREFARSGKMKADVVAYVDEKENAQILAQNASYLCAYRQHLRIGGYKIFLDGSPQGRTAWMRQPYEGAEDGYAGYPIYTDEQVLAYMQRAYAEGRQILVHCNGDAAAEQMISCCENVQRLFPKKEIRPVMIHAQFVQPNQLKRMEKLGVIASFFVAHTWYWGDTHLENLGRRAEYISPVRTAIDTGVKINFHQDSPVIPPNMIETLWCAVNRKTQKGKILGKDEQCSVKEAMLAVTKWAAYAYFEEAQKGMLAEGKLADMVILSENPLNCPAEKLQRIQILETIKGGETVYTKEET